MKIELYNDNFQNYKAYNLPTKAQLVIADIPYNLGSNAYASNKNWWLGADIKKGASEKAGKSFFKTDEKFNIAEFFHFSAKMLKPEPKEVGAAPAMIIFCAYQQLPMVAEYGKEARIYEIISVVFHQKQLAAGVEGEYEDSRSSRDRAGVVSR